MDVLFVDNEPDFLEQAKIFLEREDDRLAVETAVSAEEGLQKLAVNDYDAIVSDYRMPEMDGLEFLETVRGERSSDIPFIIFTGRGREEVAMDALNLGADRYLQKGGSPKSQYGVLAEAIVDEVRHRQVEERLELTNYSLENVDVGALWISPDGRIKYTNKKICQNLGYDKNEIVGMTISDIDPNYPDERPEIWEEIKEKGRKTFRSEHRTKEGKTIPVRITSHYLERNGEEYEFAFVRDITERERREEELKEKTEMLEGMLDGVQDVIGFQKPDHTVIRYNRTGYELLGMSPEEVKGKKCYKLIGRDEECEKCATRRALKSKSIETVEKYQPELNKYLRVTSNPVLDENGEVSFIIEQLQDITERKKSEERFETFFEELGDAVFITGLGGENHGEILEVNSAAVEETGYSRKELIGMDIHDLIVDTGIEKKYNAKRG